MQRVTVSLIPPVTLRHWWNSGHRFSQQTVKWQCDLIRVDWWRSHQFLCHELLILEMWLINIVISYRNPNLVIIFGNEGRDYEGNALSSLHAQGTSSGPSTPPVCISSSSPSTGGQQSTSWPAVSLCGTATVQLRRISQTLCWKLPITATARPPVLWKLLMDFTLSNLSCPSSSKRYKPTPASASRKILLSVLLLQMFFYTNCAVLHHGHEETTFIPK